MKSIKEREKSKSSIFRKARQYLRTFIHPPHSNSMFRLDPSINYIRIWITCDKIEVVARQLVTTNKNHCDSIAQSFRFVSFHLFVHVTKSIVYTLQFDTQVERNQSAYIYSMAPDVWHYTASGPTHRTRANPSHSTNLCMYNINRRTKKYASNNKYTKSSSN